MSRRRPGSGATISLFPFLAVLLCTMGSLLVLLVIFSRRARESEIAAARAAEEAHAEELELARDELRWRIEQLQGVRARTAEDLARERMRLAGIEEDARKLADELAALEETAAALGREEPGDDGAAAATEAEQRLAQARAALNEAREAGASRPPAYAVVPYEGANGTHRRPLYVECCIDGVFLQPEGIRLGPGDFEGPPGPGNPLASGLRAAREHIAGNAAAAGDPATQPYPLLLVRPSGVMAYYAAREALTSWGSEFGYQFVDEDWQLQYPPADAALAAVEQRAIDESRQRLEWLAQVRPARPARPTQQYRAATTRGGVVTEGGPTVLGDQSRFDWTEEQAEAAGRRHDAGGTGGTGGTGERAGGSSAATASGDVVLGGLGAGGGNAGDRYAGPSRFYATQPPASAGAGGEGGDGAGGPHAAGTQSAPGLGGADARGLAGVAGGGPGGDSPTAGGGAAAAGSGGAAGGAAGSSAQAGSGSGMASASAGGATGGGGGMSGGPSLPGMRQASGGSSGAAGSATASLAGSRGSNWASLATAERPVPLTRPIRVECAADEFRLYDDGGNRIETRIPIGTRTADSIDPLVQAVHARVGRWGLAGDRMYWRPELVLSATADGGSRREDLERLLADSGLDTRRVEPDPRVLPLPPVSRTTAVTDRR